MLSSADESNENDIVASNSKPSSSTALKVLQIYEKPHTHSSTTTSEFPNREIAGFSKSMQNSSKLISENPDSTVCFNDPGLFKDACEEDEYLYGHSSNLPPKENKFEIEKISSILESLPSTQSLSISSVYFKNMNLKEVNLKNVIDSILKHTTVSKSKYHIGGAETLKKEALDASTSSEIKSPSTKKLCAFPKTVRNSPNSKNKLSSESTLFSNNTKLSSKRKLKTPSKRLPIVFQQKQLEYINDYIRDQQRKHIRRKEYKNNRRHPQYENFGDLSPDRYSPYNLKRSRSRSHETHENFGCLSPMRYSPYDLKRSRSRSHHKTRENFSCLSPVRYSPYDLKRSRSRSHHRTHEYKSKFSDESPDHYYSKRSRKSQDYNNDSSFYNMSGIHSDSSCSKRRGKKAHKNKVTKKKVSPVPYGIDSHFTERLVDASQTAQIKSSKLNEKYLKKISSIPSFVKESSENKNDNIEEYKKLKWERNLAHSKVKNSTEDLIEMNDMMQATWRKNIYPISEKDLYLKCFNLINTCRNMLRQYSEKVHHLDEELNKFKAKQSLEFQQELTKIKTEDFKEANSTETYNVSDSNNHVCRPCNKQFMCMSSYLEHILTLQHKKKSASDEEWLENFEEQNPEEKKRNICQKVQIEGIEFLKPGFHCVLCKKTILSDKKAEQHLLSHDHFVNYKIFIQTHPLYIKKCNFKHLIGQSLVFKQKRKEKNLAVDSRKKEVAEENVKEILQKEQQKYQKQLGELKIYSDDLNSTNQKLTNVKLALSGDKVRKNPQLSEQFKTKALEEIVDQVSNYKKHLKKKSKRENSSDEAPNYEKHLEKKYKREYSSDEALNYEKHMKKKSKGEFPLEKQCMRSLNNSACRLFYDQACKKHYAGDRSHGQLLKEDDHKKSVMCNICNVECSSPVSYAEHKQGARHQKHITEARHQKYISEARHRESYRQHQTESRKQKIEDGLYCDICNVESSGPTSHIQHMSGTRHYENLKLHSVSRKIVFDRVNSIHKSGRLKEAEPPKSISTLCSTPGSTLQTKYPQDSCNLIPIIPKKVSKLSSKSDNLKLDDVQHKKQSVIVENEGTEGNVEYIGTSSSELLTNKDVCLKKKKVEICISSSNFDPQENNVSQSLKKFDCKKIGLGDISTNTDVHAKIEANGTKAILFGKLFISEKNTGKHIETGDSALIETSSNNNSLDNNSNDTSQAININVELLSIHADQNSESSILKQWPEVNAHSQSISESIDIEDGKDKLLSFSMNSIVDEKIEINKVNVVPVSIPVIEEQNAEENLEMDENLIIENLSTNDSLFKNSIGKFQVVNKYLQFLTLSKTASIISSDTAHSEPSIFEQCQKVIIQNQNISESMKLEVGNSVNSIVDEKKNGEHIDSGDNTLIENPSNNDSLDKLPAIDISVEFLTADIDQTSEPSIFEQWQVINPVTEEQNVEKNLETGNNNIIKTFSTHDSLDKISNGKFHSLERNVELLSIDDKNSECSILERCQKVIVQEQNTSESINIDCKDRLLIDSMNSNVDEKIEINSVKVIQFSEPFIIEKKHGEHIETGDSTFIGIPSNNDSLDKNSNKKLSATDTSVELLTVDIDQTREPSILEQWQEVHDQSISESMNIQNSKDSLLADSMNSVVDEKIEINNMKLISIRNPLMEEQKVEKNLETGDNIIIETFSVHDSLDKISNGNFQSLGRNIELSSIDDQNCESSILEQCQKVVVQDQNTSKGINIEDCKDRLLIDSMNLNVDEKIEINSVKVIPINIPVIKKQKAEKNLEMGENLIIETFSTNDSLDKNCNRKFQQIDTYVEFLTLCETATIISTHDIDQNCEPPLLEKCKEVIMEDQSISRTIDIEDSKDKLLADSMNSIVDEKVEINISKMIPFSKSVVEELKTEKNLEMDENLIIETFSTNDSLENSNENFQSFDRNVELSSTNTDRNNELSILEQLQGVILQDQSTSKSMDIEDSKDIFFANSINYIVEEKNEINNTKGSLFCQTVIEEQNGEKNLETCDNVNIKTLSSNDSLDKDSNGKFQVVDMYGKFLTLSEMSTIISPDSDQSSKPSMLEQCQEVVIQEQNISESLNNLESNAEALNGSINFNVQLKSSKPSTFEQYQEVPVQGQIICERIDIEDHKNHISINVDNDSVEQLSGYSETNFLAGNTHSHLRKNSKNKGTSCKIGDKSHMEGQTFLQVLGTEGHKNDDKTSNYGNLSVCMEDLINLPEEKVLCASENILFEGNLGFVLEKETTSLVKESEPCAIQKNEHKSSPQHGNPQITEDVLKASKLASDIE